MPTLNWIGKDAVLGHHKQVPFRLLKPIDKSCVGDHSGNPLSISCNCWRQQGG
jgi:adenine-specific DNA-methyltransferase